MRYTLRNKEKIIRSFDVDFYNMLIASLDGYFKRGLTSCHHPDFKYRFIQTPCIPENINIDLLEFYLIRYTYDVYTLAYKGVILK